MDSQNVIDFMGKRKIAGVVSITLIVLSVVSMFVNGLQLGLDFTGGTSIELEFKEAPQPEDVRQTLVAQGHDNSLVQEYGSKNVLLIRLQTDTAAKDEEGNAINIGAELAELLAAQLSTEVIVKQEAVVGAQIGEELANDGGLGMLAALAAVFLYVMFRFQAKFSIGALAALVHDVVIVLGFFSALRLEFDLTVLAAILAVVGYSLNDTIVVSDRIRENFRVLRSGSPLEIVNTSLTQTLGRTLMTSGTTMLVLFALFFLGGELIHNFSTALLVGVTVGTYSSMYVAGTTLLLLNISKEDLAEVEKEGAELDSLP